MDQDEVVVALQSVRNEFASKQSARQDAITAAQAVVKLNGPVVAEYQSSLDAIDALIAKLQAPAPSPVVEPVVPDTGVPVDVPT